MSEIIVVSMGKRRSFNRRSKTIYAYTRSCPTWSLPELRSRERRDSKEENRNGVQNVVRRVTTVPARYRTRATAVCTDPV